MAKFRITQLCDMYDDDGHCIKVLQPGTIVSGSLYGELLMAEVEGLPGGECWIVHPEYFEEVAAKRVVQISVDILVDGEIDGSSLAEEIRQRLDNAPDICPLGAEFVADLIETYEKEYPELLVEEE